MWWVLFHDIFLLFLFFSYPGVFQDGCDLNAICASLRILHFVSWLFRVESYSS